ncbi:hypothetical protein ACNKHM_15125 [Shigella sonnei]
MTRFALSWFGNHSEAYTLAGIGHNPRWVTLGKLYRVPYSWDWVIRMLRRKRIVRLRRIESTETAAVNY